MNYQIILHTFLLITLFNYGKTSLVYKWGYTLLENKETWNEARQSCNDIGQTMLRIESEAELNSLLTLFPDQFKHGVWLGLHKSVTGRYFWDDCVAFNEGDWMKWRQLCHLCNSYCGVMTQEAAGDSCEHEYFVICNNQKAEEQYFQDQGTVDVEVSNLTWTNSDVQTCLDHCSTIYNENYECAFIEYTKYSAASECKFYFRKYFYIILSLPSSGATTYFKRSDDAGDHWYIKHYHRDIQAPAYQMSSTQCQQTCSNNINCAAFSYYASYCKVKTYSVVGEVMALSSSSYTFVYRKKLPVQPYPELHVYGTVVDDVDASYPDVVCDVHSLPEKYFSHRASAELSSPVSSDYTTELVSLLPSSVYQSHYLTENPTLPPSQSLTVSRSLKLSASREDLTVNPTAYLTESSSGFSVTDHNYLAKSSSLTQFPLEHASVAEDHTTVLEQSSQNPNRFISETLLTSSTESASYTASESEESTVLGKSSSSYVLNPSLVSSHIVTATTSAIMSDVNTVYKITPTTTSPVMSSGHHLISNHTSETVCSCRCKETASVATATSYLINSIVSRLSVDRKKLSSTRRMMTSARDCRLSSTTLGGVGLIILISVITVIVILDVPRFVVHVNRIRNAMEKFSRVR